MVIFLYSLYIFGGNPSLSLVFSKHVARNSAVKRFDCMLLLFDCCLTLKVNSYGHGRTVS